MGRSQNLFKLGVHVILVGLVSIVEVQAGDSVGDLKKKFAKELQAIQTLVLDLYAPRSFKTQTFQLDLNHEFQNEVKRIQSLASPTTRDLQDSVKNLIGSTRDYHVSVKFFSTESASLPLTLVTTHDGRLFIGTINRKKLSPAQFNFAPGDEIVSFGGEPATVALAKVAANFRPNVEGSDQGLAAFYMTKRARKRGFQVPKGSVNLGVRRAGQAQVQEVSLVWDYTPEKIKPLSPLVESLHGAAAMQWTTRGGVLDRQFITPLSELAAEGEDPYSLGSRAGFLPVPGEIVWKNPDSSLFDAAIFIGPNQKKMGWIRIANYTPENANAYIEEFAFLMERFQSETTALVIDQSHNPGGSAFYLYALASHLSDKPLVTPYHKMTITQAEVMEAITLLDKLEDVQSDEEIQKIVGSTLSGYPVTYQTAQLLKDYFRFVISEWQKGHTLTDPFYLYGVDQINPASKPYTHPLVVITDELDFSGGDFFPAIMQDNKRAIIFGNRTAGAGGYILPISFPNLMGIDELVLTGSLALRLGQTPIENLGVTPQVPYRYSGEDFEGLSFAGFKKAILETLKSL